MKNFDNLAKIKAQDAEYNDFVYEPLQQEQKRLKPLKTAENRFPWKQHNPNSKIKNKKFLLRLNDYYHSALAYLVDPEEGKSMQKIARKILTEALDKKIREIENQI